VGGNQESIERDCRQIENGLLDPRFQALRTEKSKKHQMDEDCPPKQKHERKRPLLWVDPFTICTERKYDNIKNRPL
jgi:hypothetical protein